LLLLLYIQATQIYIKQPATTLFLIQSVPYDQYEVRAPL